MKEKDEQAAICDYIQTRYPDVLFWSTPNGAELAGRTVGQRVARMNALKKTGLLPGVSDLILYEPRGGFSAMFLEMKRDASCKPTENQVWFLAQVEQNGRGGYGVVAHGFDEARQMINEYLSWSRTVFSSADTQTPAPKYQEVMR
jgi:hypothetical protein